MIKHFNLNFLNPLLHFWITPPLVFCQNICLNQSLPTNLPMPNFNLQPVGTGPYKFDHLTTSGGQITGVVLDVNEDYYLQRPFIEQIVFRFYPNSASAFDAYQQGEVLGVSQLTGDVLQQALMEPTLSVYTSRLPQMGLVFLNLNNPSVSFLQSEKIRHALLLGINRNQIVSHIMQGQAIIADGPILPGSWAYYDEIETL